MQSAEKPPVNHLARFAVTLPINIFLIAVLLRTMLYFIWLQDHAEEVYGKSSWWKYWPTVLYSVTPILAAGAYDQIAIWLNDFEEHSTKATYQNHLILKLFAVQVSATMMWNVGRHFRHTVCEPVLRTFLHHVLASGSGSPQVDANDSIDHESNHQQFR
jgi:hypothetical protein